MNSLLHLHFIAFFIIYLNFIIFNKNTTHDLGSKYFFINYIQHNHKALSSFLITYPFIIILIYFLAANVFPIGSFFISILYVYFLYELTSRKNIVKKEEYIYWYTHNVKHSFSMHAHDMIKKDFHFLSEKIHRVFLFKFEIVFFVCLVVESEVMYEVLIFIESIK